jgi:ABC-type uncharacterized transport system auxiliary subunit
MRQASLAVLVTLALFLAGCATFERNTYKVSASIAATVDHSMRSWASYVVWTRSQDSIDQTKVAVQEQQVKRAYQQYQYAQNALFDAQIEYKKSAKLGRPALENALSGLSGASNSLLKLINSFMPTTTN